MEGSRTAGRKRRRFRFWVASIGRGGAGGNLAAGGPDESPHRSVRAFHPLDHSRQLAAVVREVQLGLQRLGIRRVYSHRDDASFDGSIPDRRSMLLCEVGRNGQLVTGLLYEMTVRALVAPGAGQVPGVMQGGAASPVGALVAGSQRQLASRPPQAGSRRALASALGIALRCLHACAGGCRDIRSGGVRR